MAMLARLECYSKDLLQLKKYCFELQKIPSKWNVINSCIELFESSKLHRLNIFELSRGEICVANVIPPCEWC